MITRRQARELRAVFRHIVLGLPPRGPMPPIVLRADDGELRAYNRIVDGTAMMAAMTTAALGLQRAGIAGAIIGFGADYYLANGVLVGYRFIRR